MPTKPQVTNMGVQVPLGLFRLVHSGPRRSNVMRVRQVLTCELARRSTRFGGDGHAGQAGGSAEAEAARVGTEFEGLEDVAADSGGKEFGTTRARTMPAPLLVIADRSPPRTAVAVCVFRCARILGLDQGADGGNKGTRPDPLTARASRKRPPQEARRQRVCQGASGPQARVCRT